jgi:ABC-2 type transport system ATP-binding protein
MAVLLEASNLSRYYGHHCAVSNLSFRLQQGEILGLLGPNGAGKTTTMQMLTGNLSPSAGQILINGHDILDQPKQAKLSLGYLPDTPPLYRDLTVSEFLHYCARLHAIPTRDVENAVNQALQRCGLLEVNQRLISNLSKGFQQRVGIAQAIIHEPDVIILDEPTTGLDPIQIKEIRHLIKALGERHAIILSTHILSEVQESCSHVQIINQGQLILQETISGLNQIMATQYLRLVTDKPVITELIDQIPNVLQVQIIQPQTCQIEYQHQSPADAVARLVIEQNWGLIELAPIKRTLEDIFIHITATNPEHPPHSF